VPGFGLGHPEIQVADHTAHRFAALARGIREAAVLQPVAVAGLPAATAQLRKPPGLTLL
jgi:hypothetical protein